MDIRYQIFREEHLLIQKFYGFFSIDKYMNYIRQIMSCPDSDYVKKVLVDFREMLIDDGSKLFDDTIDKIINIRKNINQNEIKRDDIVHVFWVDKPLPTVIAQLFTENCPELEIYYASTEKNVRNLLELSPDFGELEMVINTLKNTA